MCAIVEEYANEVAGIREKEAVLKANRKAIINGFRGGVLTKKGAVAMYPKMKKADIDALYQEAQKPARGKRKAAQ